MHLHSCPLETLQKGDVIEALEKTVKAGKVRVAAYSGENEALEYAVSTESFGSIQTSINICVQRVIEKGKLPQSIIVEVRNAFRNNDEDWVGQV